MGYVYVLILAICESAVVIKPATWREIRLYYLSGLNNSSQCHVSSQEGHRGKEASYRQGGMGALDLRAIKRLQPSESRKGKERWSLRVLGGSSALPAS